MSYEGVTLSEKEEKYFESGGEKEPEAVGESTIPGGDATEEPTQDTEAVEAAVEEAPEETPEETPEDTQEEEAKA